MEEKAERRVKQRIALLHHIGIYVIVNAFLVIVWALTYTGYPWFLWVMAGWGVGLAIHIITYLLSSKDDSARHRMIEREVEKIKREQGPPPEQ